MGLGDMLQAQHDAEDARRYRFLREKHECDYLSEPTKPWVVQLVRENGIPTMQGVWGPDLDAAIDKAERSLGKGESPK